MARSRSRKRKRSPRKSPRKSSRRGSTRKYFRMSYIGRCDRSSQKKYINRPGPPYPAQNCKNHEKKGNDGKMYKSTSNKNGIFSWKLI